MAVERLTSLVERIERLEEEKANLLNDIKEVKSEAKGAGFDVKIINIIIAKRKLDPAKREEQDFMVDTYQKALRM